MPDARRRDRALSRLAPPQDNSCGLPPPRARLRGRHRYPSWRIHRPNEGEPRRAAIDRRPDSSHSSGNLLSCSTAIARFEHYIFISTHDRGSLGGRIQIARRSYCVARNSSWVTERGRQLSRRLALALTRQRRKCREHAPPPAARSTNRPLRLPPAPSCRIRVARRPMKRRAGGAVV
jgi:hypothetical protein